MTAYILLDTIIMGIMSRNLRGRKRRRLMAYASDTITLRHLTLVTTLLSVVKKLTIPVVKDKLINIKLHLINCEIRIKKVIRKSEVTS